MLGEWKKRGQGAMGNVMPFGEVLEAVGNLSLEEQETLVDVLQRRIIEHRREELASDIQQAQQEFEEGRCRPVAPAELMKEILT
ncbi:MAG TPA: hypothetical protein VEH53_00470 [archaeon]|nr:hypothetical protein [archaeon]